MLLDKVKGMSSELDDLKVGSQALPKGFKWGAVKAGIKASGKLDVAVAVPDKAANSAFEWCCD